MTDLASFAKENPTMVGTECWACHIPEAAELNRCKRDRIATVTHMVTWLIAERGYSEEEARRPRLTNHFQAKHHERWPEGRS
jgi:hypothetical protein